MVIEEEGESFKFEDKRRLSPDTGEIRKGEPPKPESTAEPPPQPEPPPQQEQPHPPLEVNFTGFVLSLSTQAGMLMGAIPDPQAEKPVEDLQAAKQLINILGMLKEKTKGNLEKEEEQIFDRILFDLRSWFVERSQKK